MSMTPDQRSQLIEISNELREVSTTVENPIENQAVSKLSELVAFVALTPTGSVSIAALKFNFKVI